MSHPLGTKEFEDLYKLHVCTKRKYNYYLSRLLELVTSFWEHLLLTPLLSIWCNQESLASYALIAFPYLEEHVSLHVSQLHQRIYYAVVWRSHGRQTPCSQFSKGCIQTGERTKYKSSTTKAYICHFDWQVLTSACICNVAFICDLTRAYF